MYEDGQRAIVPEFSGRAIFCEDIRQEASGQISVIGWLPDEIRVENFPTTLPKLCVVIELQMSWDAEQYPITLKGFLPGASADDPYISTELAFPQELQLAPPPPDRQMGPYPGGPVRRAQQYVRSVGLEIREAGTIQYRAFRNGVVYAVGAMLVSQEPLESPKA